MKILKTSILPAAIGLLAMGAFETAFGYANPARAVLQYSQSGNSVENHGLVWSPSANYAYGIRFSGTHGTATDSNVVTNYGIIVSGSGNASYLGNAGILFDASNYGRSNGNIVTNYGSIIGAPSDNWLTSGILFACPNYGDTYYNQVKNYGNINVIGSNNSLGIGFVSASAQSANFNTVLNQGAINAFSSHGTAAGIAFIGMDGGDNSFNVVVNRGTILASSPHGNASGIAILGNNSGVANNNVISNYGTIVATGSSTMGIYLTGSNLGTANHNVINNWGTISANNGAGTAIFIENGNHNVINLGGHSVVNGAIVATGTGNVLNVAFTGVSAKAATALRAQLGTALNGQPSSGSFTVRGVTYTYDPLIVNLNVSSYEAQAKTPNEKAVGANLDSFKVNPTGGMLQILNGLDASGNVALGLEQLSPQRYQIYGAIALANANFLTQTVDQRLDNVRLGSEGLDSSGLSVSCCSAQGKLGMGGGKQAVASASMNKDGKGVSLKEVAPVEGKRWGTFLSGNLILADIDGRDQQQDSKFNSAGLVGGVDVRLSDALTAGLLLGYEHTNADLDRQDSTADVDTYTTGLYAGYRDGNYYGNGLAAYSLNDYESRRTVQLPGVSRTANADTWGSQFVLNLDGGYDQPVSKNITAGPFAGLQYVHLDVNGFRESGAKGANLAVNDQGVDSLRSRLGVRVELRKDLCCCWAVASEARLAWQHEFLNDDRAIVARFTGSGLSAFSVRTTAPERDAAVLGLGVNATYRKALTAFADYDVQVGQAHYVEQIIKGGLKYSF